MARGGVKGRSGRKKKPDAIKRMEGSRWCTDPAKQVKPEIGRPDQPEWLGSIGAKVWHSAVDRLEKIPGLLAKIDGDALALYCDAWEDYLTARETIANDGRILESRYTKTAHPAIKEKNSAAARIQDGLSRFGMSPRDRAGIEVLVETEKEPWRALLSDVA